ncbi:MAG TPA: hypothetical protein DEF43_17080 [Chloroflexus aurantiacus]|nr:MAG: hypothetical protein D6716_11630 [Chloroflexota bacterium]HBW68825.1 hypothetical protein [Chloroflexus aurantiacus]
MLSCSLPVTQANELLSITHDSISCSQAAGMVIRRADNHRRFYHTLDWLPYPLVMHVSRRLECGTMAAAAAVLTIRCVACR